ncbi:MAG: ankyrin repeat domain-containing protein [Terracidiphilus sp.]|jgi:hypothetical protein
MNSFCFSPSNRFQPSVSRPIAAVLLLVAVLASGLQAFCGPIHEAARSGDIKTVEALLKEHPDLVSSKEEKYGQTPLHIAAFNDRIEVAKLLIADKADVNAQANNGATPLHLAAAKGNKDMVELLLASKANIDATDHDGWSPLHSAVTWGQKGTEDLLRQHGGQDLPAPKLPPTTASGADANPVKTPPKETGKDGQFTAYQDGTVLDTKTNLMWTVRDNGSGLSWPGAKAYATTARTGGYTDWRLPTLSEVTALFDKTKSGKAFCPSAVDELGQAANEVHVATELIHLSCTRQWTSQESTSKPGSAAIFDFHSGNEAARPESPDFVDTASRVLLVRAAKP